MHRPRRRVDPLDPPRTPTHRDVVLEIGRLARHPSSAPLSDYELARLAGAPGDEGAMLVRRIRRQIVEEVLCTEAICLAHAIAVVEGRPVHAAAVIVGALRQRLLIAESTAGERALATMREAAAAEREVDPWD